LFFQKGFDLISVSIIEDDKHFREGLEQLINRSQQFRLKYSYASAEDALPHLLEHPPDIAIVDIKLPGKSGIDLIGEIKSALPATLCMVCTYYDDNEFVFNALKNGAVGYLLKDAQPEEILESLEELSQGGAPMNRYIARKVIASFSNNHPHSRLAELTERENEILNYLAQGLIIKEISEKLYLSRYTVKSHLKNIYSKLHVNNKVAAINKLNRGSQAQK
jgi:NarL family two-component system response regulator LiaR